MGKTLWKSQNVSLNGFFWGKHHPVPAVYSDPAYPLEMGYHEGVFRKKRETENL